MAKRIAKVVKLEILGGQAKPGSALASAGINMPQFCSAFNDKTKDKMGEVVPVVITAYDDKSFDFVIKTTPAAVLLKKAAHIETASGQPNKVKAGTVTKEDVRKIAETKMADLNANDIEAAMKIIEGTARQMGIEVKE